MGRPATKPAGAVFVRRDTREQMLVAAEEYKRTKQVNVLGEIKNDKWLD